MLCDDGDANDWQQPPETRREAWNRFSLRASGRDHPFLYIDLRFLASRTGREFISVVLIHPVCGILLWQPWDTNTPLQECCLSQTPENSSVFLRPDLTTLFSLPATVPSQWIKDEPAVGVVNLSPTALNSGSETPVCFSSTWRTVIPWWLVPYPQDFQLSRSGAGSENVRCKQAPAWCWCCCSRQARSSSSFFQ